MLSQVGFDLGQESRKPKVTINNLNIFVKGLLFEECCDEN